MVAISITITTSSDQIVSGIPRTVSIATNIPSTIFFTLDGSDPTLFSSIYTSPIQMPSAPVSITLKVLATNGVDFSPIVSETYTTNIINDTRLPHSATDAQPQDTIPNLYPFGTNPIQPTGNFLNPADASITVDNPALPEISNVFDADQNPTDFTNQPFTVENYSIQYSTTDAEGQKGRGIGNLPANVKIKDDVAPPEESNQFTNTFDPRAQVIFQDMSKENSGDPATINRQFFTLEDPERSRDGTAFLNAGLDSPPVMGSFVRSFINARTNEITYYYFESMSNRWIISKSPYVPNGKPFDGELAGQVFGRGSSRVIEWIPGQRRVLF